MASIDVQFEHTPSDRHNRNVLEFKHGAIRIVNLRFVNDSSVHTQLCAFKAVGISSELTNQIACAHYILPKELQI